MIYAHVFVDGRQYARLPLQTCPRIGETLRLGPEDKEFYATVSEVVWCLNEKSPMGDRVNIGSVREQS